MKKIIEKPEDKNVSSGNSHNSTSTNNKLDIVTALPPELALRIFSLLSPKDLLNVRSISSKWFKLIQKTQIWKNKLQKLGMEPRNQLQQYFLFSKTLSHIINQIYTDMLPLRQHSNDINTSQASWGFSPSLFSDSLFSYEILFDKLSVQHHFAHSIGISTYTLFKNLLDLIKLKSSDKCLEIQFTFIFYYLLSATKPTSVYIKNTDFLLTPSNESNSNANLGFQDYQDIVDLLSYMICKNIINLNKAYAGFNKKPLEYLCNTIDFDNLDCVRPSPTVIQLLINSGADIKPIQMIGSITDNLNLNFSQLLLIYEIIFHSNIASLWGYFTEVKQLYIKKYGDFVSRENFATTQASPLSNEFLNLASVIFQKGGDFSTYNELEQFLLYYYNTTKVSLLGNRTPLFINSENGTLKTQIAERFKNAFTQLEQLKRSLKLEKSQTNSIN